MDQADHDQRQRNLEQNVYASAATAQQQLTALRNIETLLKRIYWLVVLAAIFGLTSLLSR